MDFFLKKISIKKDKDTQSPPPCLIMKSLRKNAGEKLKKRKKEKNMY